MNNNKRKAVKDSSNNPRKTKRISAAMNYNKYFTEEVPPAEKNEATSSSSLQSSPTNQKERSVVQMVDLTKMDEFIPLVENMSAVCNISLNQLDAACKTIRLLRTKPTLGIREIEISKADGPLLTMFEKYALPLKTKEEVEGLENLLENSDDFLKFFVS